jgi:hypothetical protein
VTWASASTAHLNGVTGMFQVLVHVASEAAPRCFFIHLKSLKFNDFYLFHEIARAGAQVAGYVGRP